MFYHGKANQLKWKQFPEATSFIPIVSSSEAVERKQGVWCIHVEASGAQVMLF